MSFSERSGLASNAVRWLDEQEVLDGSAWCLPFGSSRWKKMKSCDLKVEISV